jgi:hypothetical protein
MNSLWIATEKYIYQSLLARIGVSIQTCLYCTPFLTVHKIAFFFEDRNARSTPHPITSHHASLLFLTNLLGVLPRGVTVGEHFWQEFADKALILLVFWVLLSCNQLGQPSAALKEQEIGEGASKSPVHECVGRVASPLIQHDPDGLLGSEVWVTGPGPKTAHYEATIEIFGVVFAVRWDFGCCLVVFFGILVACSAVSFTVCLKDLSRGANLTPLLLISKEFNDYKTNQDTGENDVSKFHLLLSLACGEHHDVGRGGNEE